ncbi:BadF/BadG/BcrA/BcrD ATPase family protein [Microbacterium sp. NPDC057659]|uniref:BadF/BadG/BcrA/BcrD ATPase family protein n=1 Tax=Microbacterium sp. NPDC057659 TaxID=3346198 RepID=UPI00366C5E11
MRSDAPVLLGIDAGGTKVHVRWASVDGTVIEDRVVRELGWGAASFVDRAAVVAGLAAERPVRAIGIGSHGCDSDAECEDLRSRVAAQVPVPVAVVNDAELLGHAVGRPHAINVVLGTGSIVVHRGSGEARYLGGWGWLVGDDGSAWGLVRNAVAALSDGVDVRSSESDPLQELLLTASGSSSLRDLVDVMQTSPASEWASWADAIFAVESESAAAQTAIDLGVSRTARLVERVRALSAQADHVVFAGGVVANQRGYAARLEAAVRDRTGLQATVLDGPPVAGAVRLAAAVAD